MIVSCRTVEEVGVEPLVMDEDTTRWGVNPGHGLSDVTRAFLHSTVGVPSAAPAPVAWADVHVPPSALTSGDLAELQQLLGSAAVAIDPRTRLASAGGLSYLDLLARRTDNVRPPDAVVTPPDEDGVAAVLAWAGQRGIAVVPRGGGTSVVGGLRAVAPVVIAVSTARLDRIWEVDRESHLVTVGAGITGPELERQLATMDLTLGHYPQSWQRASIGGYIATRSAGQASSGYGRSDDMVAAVRMVTPRGIFEAGRPPASAAGPDLLQLAVGSEGAFGIVTRVTLRVRALPAASDYTAVVFPDYLAGLAAFRGLVQSRNGADVMRLSDPEETAVTLAMNGPTGRAAELLERYLHARGVTEPSLAILGWDGSRAAVTARHASALGELRRQGAVSLSAAIGNSWVRHRFSGPYLRDTLMDEGYLVETLETATRWSQVASLRHSVAGALRASLHVPEGTSPFVMSHVSHVYETGASLYFTVIAVADPNDPVGQWQRAKVEVMQTLTESGATITHHHAVGRDHAPWLTSEVGQLGVDVLRAVKRTLDPEGVLNPGVLGM